ncbi:hypothetical protein M9458_010257, partial [Cirrhinus mrigala]
MCNGHAASGIRLAFNCLELLTMLRALKRFRLCLVCTENTATVVYIDHQDGVRSFHMSQLTRHLLLWSQHRLKLLCATHIPRRQVRSEVSGGSTLRRSSCFGVDSARH